MATTKKAAPKKTGTAVAKATGTALVSLEAEVKAELESLQGRVGAPGGDVIAVGQDKQFKLPDGSKHPGPLRVVIVAFTTGRFFYDRPFDARNPCPPACFSISAQPKGMVPDKDGPVVQAKECDKCPMNEFGSAGDGKACKEMRMLAVIPEDADADTAVAVIKTSPTALKAFDSYVLTLQRSLGKATFQVVTEIGFDPKLDYPSLRFGNPEPASADLVNTAMGLREAARQRLAAAPDTSQYSPPGRAAAKSTKRK